MRAARKKERERDLQLERETDGDRRGQRGAREENAAESRVEWSRAERGLANGRANPGEEANQ